MNQYSVTKVKQFRGNEGYGFNADLLCNGKKVAFVYDDANGGMYRYEWSAKDREQARADEQAFSTYAKALPPMELDGQSFPQDMDSAMDHMVTAAQVEQQLERMLKTKVLLVRPDGVLINLKSAKPTPDILTRAAAQFAGHQLVNLLPRAEALAVLRAKVG